MMADRKTYRIQVEGPISERWTHWFDDMTIVVGDNDGALAITTLTGPVADQAALLGLLQKLYTLRLPLVLVIREEAETMDDARHRACRR